MSEAKPENQDLIVVARTPSEMQEAQTKMVAWAENKVEISRAEIQEAEESLAQAVKGKFRQTGFKKMVAKACEKLCYYEKLKAALEAGFVIVPNFDLDIFAIRTTKSRPKSKSTESRHGMDRSAFEQKSERPQLGEGEYKDSFPATKGVVLQDENEKGEMVKYHREWATKFQDVDFPFKLAKPQILNDTANAMALKIFDEIGVTPHRQVRKQDPMVIGQIIYKGNGGYSEKRVSFLVTWWLASSDIEI